MSGTLSRKQVWNANESQILYSSDIAADDKFGSTVSVDGNYAVIGADNEDAGGSNAGAVYIFYKSGGTWAQQAKLVADDADAGDKFGRSVSIYGDYVVVSSPFEDTTATDSGSVYIFKRSGTTWSQQQQIQASDAADSDFLGAGIGQGGGGIAIDNDYFIIGAVNNDDSGANSGSAYIFKRGQVLSSVTYPTIAMTANSSSGCISSSSSNLSGWESWKAFNHTINNEGWHTNGGNYDSSNGNFSGSQPYSTTYDGSSTVSGEWIQIQFSSAISIVGINIAPRSPPSNIGQYEDRCPGDGRILGSNDGSTWTSITTFNSQTYTGGSYTNITFAASSSYTYFRLVVTKLSGNDATVQCGEIQYVEQGSLVDVWSQQSKLIASDAAASDQFGTVVDISGDYAIAGAPNEDTGGSNAGAAYIFKKGTQTESGLDITPSVHSSWHGLTYNGAGTMPYKGHTFGGVTTATKFYYDATPGNIRDGVSNVGEYGTDGYVYFDTSDYKWYDAGSGLPAKYTVNDGRESYVQNFPSPAMTGSNVGSVVRFWPSSGSARFTFTQPDTSFFVEPGSDLWSQQQKIQASDAQADDSFGGGVSLSGDYLAVGARQEDTGGSQAGSVYIFKKASGSETWSQEAKLQASDVSAAAQFGMSVSLSGDVLAVGANVEDTSASDAGAAYIFERSGTTWTEVKKITASDTQASDYFGESISTDGTTTFVGAWGEDTKGSSAGAAYVYEKVYVGPTLTYDNANKLSLTGVTTPSSNLTVGTNTYDIGSASNVYIKDQGTYTFHTNDGDQALILSNVVSSTPSVTTFEQEYDASSSSSTFSYTGDIQTYTVPSGVTKIRGKCWGAGGGGGSAEVGGCGGYVGGIIDVTPGETLYVSVAQGGTIGSGRAGGGGMTGILSKWNTSDIVETHNSSIIIAGGGGGGGRTVGDPGGCGGGEIGGKGANYQNPGTQTAGGAAGVESGYTSGTAGSYFRGGNGGGDNFNTAISWPNGVWGGDWGRGKSGGGNAGGGGGGYYGAGGSAGSNRGSAGGSGYVGGDGTHEVSESQNLISSQLTNSTIPPNTSDTSYVTGGGIGGAAITEGGNGLVVIVPIKVRNITTPSQVYDNTKTITVSNIPSTQTGITGKFYKGATAYTIHATEPTSNVIIKNTGSYVSVFTTSSTAYLTNTVNVNATPTTTSDDNTIEDAVLDVTTTTSVSKTIAFHDGLFADSDDPHGDGSITAAATAGHVYSDTATGTYTWGTLTSCVRTAMTDNLYSDENFGYNNGTPPTAGFTTYKWTPPGTITNGRTLVVAGGGGGGTDMGGGGGAGGLLASTTTNIAHAEQTIQVGSGGARGYGPGNSNDHGGGDGGDSSISGPGITSIGGGGGGTANTNNGREFGRDGGSGGGTGGYYQNGNHGPRGYGTSGQGNDGGLTTASYYSSGGGGAGEVGVSGANNVPGDGGDGLEDDILGTSYWWAGGGGSNAYNNQGSGHGGKGGGGGGAATHTAHSTHWRVGLGNTNGITNGGDGENPGGNWNTATGGSGGKHTGGGGGGGQHNTGGVTTMRGGRGGSGIVAIKFTAQKTVTVPGIPGSTAVADPEPVADAPSVTLVATTEVATPTMNLDFTANMSTFPRTLKRYNGITNSSIGARFNRTESKKKRVQKSINTDTFSIELTANNMGDSSSSSSTLPVTVVNSGAGTQYTSGWTTGSTSSFAVPNDAPNALYYYSQNDDSAGGSISVSSATTTTHTVTVVSSSAGTQYGLGTSWWTVAGTPGSSGATSTFVAPSNAPSTLYYYCGAHSGMGGAINMVDGPVSSAFAVTVSSSYGSNYFYIDGTQQATISLVRGKTYTFNNNASGSHPMYITTSSDGTIYTSGVTGNSSNGTQYTTGWTTTPSPTYVPGVSGAESTFAAPSNAPNTLYYYCGAHSGMGGVINMVSGPASSTFAVTVQSVSGYYGSSSNYYFIDGTQQATISLVRGKTYTFNNNASGNHPMYITTSSDGTVYDSGVTNGGSSSVTFAVPLSAPSTLYYKCGIHGGMGGTINILGPTASPLTVTVQSTSDGNKYEINGVQQDTLQLVRGETYVFNQEDNSNGTHPIRLSETSNGTHDIGGSSIITFAVPLYAPSTLYYKCGVHGGMGGTINILGPTASPLEVTVSDGKFVIGDVSQATLQLVRGETYVFNQVDDSNETHPIRLSETSNGTWVSGGSGFYIGGTQKPTLTMVRGNTYTFDQTNASNGSHVLQIATASDGTQYTSGYTTGTFVVPLSAPDTLYYKSSTTSGMGGLINITGLSTSAFVVTFSGGKFSIGGVQQASLSVIRGLTYTFDQTESTNSTHVLLLSSTSDGTRNTGVNKYYISGVETPTLTFIRGSTYTFDQSDSTNTNHPIRLSETSNGTHASGNPPQYTSGWTTTPASDDYVPGVSGATSEFVVDADTPSTLYYYCGAHSGMGGASSINVADSTSGIILTYGTHALVANSTVSGEYTIATNFDGTTSNLYVNQVI